jgi:uncharacterized protein YprB with RNaseH-like and TPR domain
MNGHPWTPEEKKLVTKYFKSTWTLPTLFKRIHAINPNRSYDAIGNMVRRWKRNGWEEKAESALKKLRVGYLDIEATDLDGDFGYMLTWYIKPRNSKKYDYSIIKKSEIFKYEFDKRLVKELLVAFNNYDVLYTHWGVDRRFDIPFIRTRALVHGLQDQLPKKFEKFMMDTWPIARNKLKLHSNRLDSIADACRIKGVKKTPLSGEKWMLAAVGEPKSLEYIAKHNRHDVILLERVHKKLECMENKIYRSM